MSDGGALHLGYLGRSLTDEETLNIIVSRLGGDPVWPEPLVASSESGGGEPVSDHWPACGLCSGPCALVGQFSAGYGPVPRRLLHIFACAASCRGCTDPRCWRVFRSTGRRFDEPHQTADIAASEEAGAALGGYIAADDTGAATADDWGASVGGDDWGATAAPNEDWGCAPHGSVGEAWGSVTAGSAEDDWGAGDWGGVVGSGGYDAASASSATGLDAELDALLAARSANPSETSTQKARPNKKAYPAASEASASTGASAPGVKGAASNPAAVSAAVWPCRALEIYNEPAPWGTDAGEHERELLERYLASDLAKEEEAATSGTVAAATGKSLPCDLADEFRKEEASLRAESGEDGPDDEEGVGVDDDDEFGDWLSRFQRRLERSPQQVVRYEWGGEPLWMAPPPTELRPGGAWPPPCGQCGAPRIFELQLLPTLLSQVSGASSQAEWGVVVVYTCSADCSTTVVNNGDGAEERGVPCEEFVVVQPAV